MNELTAISPIDGRYYRKIKSLSNYFSEYALFKYRLYIEITYFLKFVSFIKPLGYEKVISMKNKFDDLIENFSEEEASVIKNIENVTNHDVKAVEYYLKNKMALWGLKDYTEFVHFGLTSQDINTSALMLPLKICLKNELFPLINSLRDLLNEKISHWINIPMLSRTHGQPASPSTMGKEYGVFFYRLEQQSKRDIVLYTKFGGAVGNFNAHHYSYPDINWKQFADDFCESIGLQRSQYTTQIENYDSLSETLDHIKRINTILLDLCQDTWLYISMDYFKLKIIGSEVGSSTMPHKVNPIDFENAEGNLLLANNLIEFLTRKLPVSRLQRDLTDSTITRNIGTCIAHSMLSYMAIIRGIGKLEINTSKIKSELDNNWVVVTEGIQHALRKKGFDGYEILKSVVRSNSKIDKFILKAELDKILHPKDVEDIMALTPEQYIGLL